jgi:threonine aldolase
MVFLRINKIVDTSNLTESLKKEGILINPPENGKLRLVTHYYISRKEAETVAETLRAFLSN